MDNATANRLIDLCIEEFDFDRVHKTMSFLEWHWLSFDRVHKTMSFLEWHWFLYRRTPSTEELRAKARDLLREATHRASLALDGVAGSATGGLRAMATGFNGAMRDSVPELTLDFRLTGSCVSESDLPSADPKEHLKDLLSHRGSPAAMVAGGADEPLICRCTLPSRIEGELTVATMQALFEDDVFSHWARLFPDPSDDEVTLLYAWNVGHE